jgi:PAS domain S-box-containing protein
MIQLSQVTTPVLRKLALLPNTLGWRITLAIILSNVVFVVVAMTVSYFAGAKAIEREEGSSMQYALEVKSEEVSNTLNSFASFVDNLSRQEVVSAALIDSDGRERYLKPFMDLSYVSLVRQLGKRETASAFNLRLAVLDYRGRTLISAGRLEQRFENENWVRDILSKNKPVTLFDAAKFELLISFPIVYKGTQQVEGVALGIINVANMLGLDQLSRVSRWIWRAGPPALVSTKSDLSIAQTLEWGLPLAAPLHELDWVATLAYPQSEFGRRALLSVWPLLIALVLLLPVLATVGLLVGRRLSRPIEALADITAKLTPETLDQAVMSESDRRLATREVQQLGATIFSSMSRLLDLSKEIRVTQQAMDAADIGVMILDATKLEPTLLYVNRSFEKLTGYNREEVLGRTMELLHGEDGLQDELKTLRSSLQDKKACRIVLRSYRKDGSQFRNEITLAPVFDATGEVSRIVGFLNDVTARWKLEEQLRQSQKMEAMGLLTSQLAHDFNNLLGVVVGNLDEIGEQLPPGNQKLKRNFDAALGAALQGAQVTRMLLTVARRQPMEVSVHDLNLLLSQMQTLVRSSAGSLEMVTEDLCEGALMCRLDPSGLSNVILNLVINARDAMQNLTSDRQLQIRTSRVDLGINEVAELSPGKYALLQVIDNGMGMSAEVMAQAFDPFFTTKERDKGTGLGLSIVRGYAEQLGGTAHLSSSPGKGTTVSIYLPLMEEQAQLNDVQEEVKVMSVQTATKDKRVLVVDDEEALCELACDWMEALGFKAVGVHSPSEAIAELERTHFDLLFTDVVMPGAMDGLGLASLCQERWPDMKILITSGNARGINEVQSLPGALLNKPYRKMDIAQALQDMELLV